MMDVFFLDIFYSYIHTKRKKTGGKKEKALTPKNNAYAKSIIS
jgi:hypothetical protein